MSKRLRKLGFKPKTRPLRECVVEENAQGEYRINGTPWHPRLLLKKGNPMPELKYWVEMMKGSLADTTHCAFQNGCHPDVICYCYSRDTNCTKLEFLHLVDKYSRFDALDLTNINTGEIMEFAVQSDSISLLEQQWKRMYAFQETTFNNLFWMYVQSTKCLQWAFRHEIKFPREEKSEKAYKLYQLYEDGNTDRKEILERFRIRWELNPFPTPNQDWHVWIRSNETRQFETLEEILPQVREFVRATDFERRCIKERFQGDWNDLPMIIQRNINVTVMRFHFAYVGKRLIAFYDATSPKVNWNDVSDFISSYGVRKTNAEFF